MLTRARLVMSSPRRSLTFLSQTHAASLDEDLMSDEYGFSIDQLMELAGLSVAAAVQQAYPVDTHARLLVVAGPGNNGGDALVAARHLGHFGYSPSIVYPKASSKDLFQRLVSQCRALDVPLSDTLPDALDASFDLVLDGIFGFSFKGSIRAPFDTVVRDLKASSLPILSIDIPSGWHVEDGNVSGEGLEPDALISLTAPKLCAKSFSGKYHFLGGRFVPPGIARKYNLSLPAYPGAEQVVRLS